MTEANYRVSTYDPFPYSGENHTNENYNWFNCNVIEDPAVQNGIGSNAIGKPGGFCTIFAQIPEGQRGNDFPVISHGDLAVSKSCQQGTYWSMPGDGSHMLNADEAMKAITDEIYNDGDGWNRTDKMGFMVEWVGWYGAGGHWYQKWSWQMYNTTNKRLVTPVKGIAFQFRIPTSDGHVAINDTLSGISGSNKFNPRGDQTGIDYIWGLWWDPIDQKYYVYEMTEWGAYHAPSIDPVLEDNQDPMYSPYWFARRPHDEKGGVISTDKKVQHSAFGGKKVPIMCWANEKRLEHCHFCGFCVQNETEKKVTSPASHTNQWGKLSPIPFHIDRNTPGARAVFGGFSNTTGKDIPLKTVST